MHVELVDRLRCPAAHAESWLVAHADRSEDRRILEGTLGCPVCQREFRITEGAAWMGDDEPASLAPSAVLDADGALRLAALLNVDERGGLYVLGGSIATAKDALATFDTARWILLSPPANVSAEATIRGAGDQVPLARGSVRGIAIDRPSATLATAAAAALAHGGRLVAPVGTELPHGMEELARDADQWVAQKVAAFDATVLVTPRRAAPRTSHQ
ncbi:MAG: hypothetical protein NTU67_05810 [Gemmatimonadetes bacterium]|nr:hypothetical protein [Gemmatimonadota bacterium]